MSTQATTLSTNPDGTQPLRRGWLDGLPLPSVLADGTGLIVELNGLAAELFDLRPGVSAHLGALVRAEDYPPLKALMIVLLMAPDRVETRDIGLDGAGSVSHCRVWLKAARDGSGRNAVLLQFQDMSHIAARETELLRKQARWNQALASARTGIWEYDTRRQRPYFSDSWKLLRGLDPADTTPISLDELMAAVHPEDTDRITDLVLRQRNGEQVCNVYDYRLRRTNGEWIWIECRSTTVEWGQDGKPLRIVGTDIDITERKRSEQTLERLSRRLQVALEASRIGVFEADFDAGTAGWDAGMFRVYQVEETQQVLIGGLWENMLHPEDRDRVFAKVNHHVANLLPFFDEFRVIVASGEVRFIRSHTLPFIDADGHRRMIGANWDVTDDRMLRKALEDAHRLAEARNRELEIAKAEIERVALLDPLTSLPNRRYLDSQLVRMALDPDLSSQGLGVLHIDLDRFKQINDTYGHDVGDTVLHKAAAILRENTREGDFAARIGGDEFALFAPGLTDLEDLAELATRIIDAMRKPVHVDHIECRYGASVGISVGHGSGLDPRQLLLNADIALYQAKNKGRNRFEFFTDESRNRMVLNRQTSDEILLGLDRGEFVPVYQPQFCGQTLDIVGVETLARWQHPTRGLLAPDKFLAIAQDLDMVAEIDRRILEQALADCAAWEARGFIVPKCSVNVSSERLRDPSLIKSLSTLPIRPGTIAFELLESIFLDEIDEPVATTLHHLGALGINIEIDDFGTGHASIVSLLRLRPSLLKIDRQLIAAITSSTEQRGLVQAIIQMGHSLGIRVLAEGVETDAHVQVLKALDCDFLQGYGLARPMPASAIVDFAARQSWRARS
ncbi:sensor domain-containing protein [Oryzibacter oryziterrae]|uniref:sensor domain-containing protein n=1 Tax=Oryzibacter oryziterrae TaxID=2766474 RepID=UPI001F248627|nr:GGDEF and EAL domain-containing protein [Oryzibacter oryziterrae]